MKHVQQLSIFIATAALSFMVGAQQSVCELKQTPASVYGSSPITTYFLLSLAPEKVAGLNFAQDKAGQGVLPARVFELPVIGGWFGQGQTPNKETLLSVKPDLTLMSVSSHTASVQKQQAMLTELGLPVCSFPLDTLDYYPAAYRTVGAWLGVAERGEKLAAFSEKVLADLASKRAQIQKPLKVYYAEGNDGLATECKGSLHAEVLTLAGADNPHVCEAVTGFGMVKVSLEQVLAEDPDVILTQDANTYDAIKADKRWQSVRAVKSGKVLFMSGTPWRWMDRPPSFTRLIAAPWLMHHLYPQTMTQAELAPLMHTFFQDFFNQSLSDAQVSALLNSTRE
jgi:iron complex transport system substrate-binding protein